ncbi:hypothetical protein Poly51_24770 [Rubripirellula tenax]|uniref:Competence protein A n=2 Tax=Rubripirellula tenax TaxID=2528015 RepID=A0A5C6FAI7_9BACT|nr:hypothetical protein Poly51_24770 [Rubripirellula tenax]
MIDPIRTPHNRPARPADAPHSRCFGLRIESHLLQVAIATPIDDQRFQIEIDEIESKSTTGWLETGEQENFVEALIDLVDRHNMHRHPVAVSLDGDFCVTRITTGTVDDVNRELSTLAQRIPRYLQLGPGEKVTGSTRRKIDATTDYAVTGVVNRSLIQLIYDSLRLADIEVTWVEPSLVGLARLIGQPTLWGDQPIMIADGTGKRWDVGIACSGRLLLDYRPANADSEQGLTRALDGHIARLKRFCHKQLRGNSSELDSMLICGNGNKPARALAAIGDNLGLKPNVLQVPLLPELYEIADHDRRSQCVPAVATVYPLLTGVSAADVPDLLVQVRRAPDLSWPQQIIRQFWPVAIAALVLIVPYGLVTKERRRHAGSTDGRASLESEIVASNIKFTHLASQRELFNHFRAIRQQTWEPNWSEMLTHITKSLPSSAKLNEFRVESSDQISMDGTVMEETVVYEVVNTLRRLPSVTQVALRGTTPERDSQSTRFSISLTTKSAPKSTTTGAGDE